MSVFGWLAAVLTVPAILGVVVRWVVRMLWAW